MTPEQLAALMEALGVTLDDVEEIRLTSKATYHKYLYYPNPGDLNYDPDNGLMWVRERPDMTAPFAAGEAREGRDRVVSWATIQIEVITWKVPS